MERKEVALVADASSTATKKENAAAASNDTRISFEGEIDEVIGAEAGLFSEREVAGAEEKACQSAAVEPDEVEEGDDDNVDHKSEDFVFFSFNRSSNINVTKEASVDYSEKEAVCSSPSLTPAPLAIFPKDLGSEFDNSAVAKSVEAVPVEDVDTCPEFPCTVHNERNDSILINTFFDDAELRKGSVGTDDDIFGNMDFPFSDEAPGVNAEEENMNLFQSQRDEMARTHDDWLIDCDDISVGSADDVSVQLLSKDEDPLREMALPNSSSVGSNHSVPNAIAEYNLAVSIIDERESATTEDNSSNRIHCEKSHYLLSEDYLSETISNDQVFNMSKDKDSSVLVSDRVEMNLQHFDNEMLTRRKIFAMEETSFPVVADEDDALLRTIDKTNTVIESIVHRNNLENFIPNDDEGSIDEFSRRRKIFASDESVSVSVVSKEHEELLQTVERTNAIVEKIVQRNFSVNGDESVMSHDSASCTSSITHLSSIVIPEEHQEQLIAGISDVTTKIISENINGLTKNSISDRYLSPQSGTGTAKEMECYSKSIRNGIEEQKVVRHIDQVVLKDDTQFKTCTSPGIKPRYQRLYEKSISKRSPKKEPFRSKESQNKLDHSRSKEKRSQYSKEQKTFKRPAVFDRLYNLSMPMQKSGKTRRQKIQNNKKYKLMSTRLPIKINPGPGPRLYEQGMLRMFRLEKRRAEKFGPGYKSPIWPPKTRSTDESLLHYLLS